MVQLAVQRGGRSVLAVTLMCAAAGVSLAIFGAQLRNVDLSGLASGPHLLWLVAACAATGLSLIAAVHNLTAFAPRPLPLLDTLRAQLAVCGLRVLAPSAISTPAVCARYLNRSGLGGAESMAVVGTAQAAQFLMTVLLVTTLAVAAPHTATAPDPLSLGLWGAATAIALALAVLAARRVPAVRRAVTAARQALGTVLGDARRRPLRVVGGLASSAALTLAHVTAFDCCVAATGGQVTLLGATAIYLGAVSAGSLIPTPAGVGAVEAAMIGGLVASGVDGGAATAAALITRLITVWLLVLPGWIAARTLRRRGLL